MVDLRNHGKVNKVWKGWSTSVTLIEAIALQLKALALLFAMCFFSQKS